MRQALCMLRNIGTLVVFSQQAEAVANGRRRILAEAFSSASSSLEEPLAGASQHEHEPAA